MFSALEVCYDNALYKFTFDIDIDIDITRPTAVMGANFHGIEFQHSVLMMLIILQDDR